MKVRSLATLAFALLAGTAAAHADTFSLDDSLGAQPTFSVTSANGNVATFTSPAGNGFTVQNTFGIFSFSTGLVDDNFFGGSDPLTIAFSSPLVGAIYIPFGVEDFFGGPDTLLLTANTGQTASFTAVGNGVGLSDPQGAISLQLAAATQSITLTSSNPFAIGSIAATPEPGSLVLLSTGLAGLAALRRRVQQRKA